MSSSHEGTEIRSLNPSGTLESDPSEKNNHDVTTEEIKNQKLDKKGIRTELDAKNSDVRVETVIKQDNSVERSGADSIGDIASEPKTDVEKTRGLEPESEEGISGQETQSMKSCEHREKELCHVALVPEMSTTAIGMPSRTRYVVKHGDLFGGSEKRELIKCFNNTVLGMYSKDKSEEYDQTRDFKSSGYHFLSRSVLDRPCSELEPDVGGSFSFPVFKQETLQLSGGFDTHLTPSESVSESEDEDDAISDSEEDSVEDQASSRGDETSVGIKLRDNISKFISREQESILFGENVKVVKVSAKGFTAERVEPFIIVLGDIFRISFDISRFSKESISCRVVGNRVDVYALESRSNDYGYEMHEIHQIFKIPLHVDKDKFKASVKNGLLFMEAPLQIGL